MVAKISRWLSCLSLFPVLLFLLSGSVLAENLCALTFDDGPSRHTGRLLDALERHNIRATFFVLGENAARHKTIIKRMSREGHEIGNHSWSHPNMGKLPKDDQAAQILATMIILDECGAQCRLYRPPYGISNGITNSILKRYGLRKVLWSVDSLDWKRLPNDYSRLPDVEGKHFKEGKMRGIFLFHDIHARTVNDIERIISGLKAGGCEKFVTVSDYLAGTKRAKK